MPAGCDAEVASLFRDLRVASNLTETDLAARIATPVEVVQALEQGALYALPPWPETCRVVNAYGTMLNLDTGPLLRRIYAQLEAGIVELRPKAVPDVPVMAPPGGGDFGLGHANAGAAPAPQPMPQAPAPQAPPQQVPWPNGQPAAQPQAPSHQAPWPGGASQFPQGGGVGGVPQQAPLAPPPQAPLPQAPSPQAPSPQAPWANGPQGALQPEQPQFPPELPGQGFPGEPQPAAMPGEDASMGGEEAEPKRKKPALLKWGLGALVASVILVGLWMALSDSSGPTLSSGSSSTSDPVLDPDDPRSRKADRLPNNF